MDQMHLRRAPAHCVPPLNLNSNADLASGKCKDLACIIRHKKTKTNNFCLSKYHKIVWNSKDKFNITKSMRAKINLLNSMSTSPAAFCYDIPIIHVIST